MMLIRLILLGIMCAAFFVSGICTVFGILDYKYAGQSQMPVPKNPLDVKRGHVGNSKSPAIESSHTWDFGDNTEMQLKPCQEVYVADKVFKGSNGTRGVTLKKEISCD